MEQTSAANTRKQNIGNSQGGGQQSNNEGGGNKGMRKQGSSSGQTKQQHQTGSGSQSSGQTKQTQNQYQQVGAPNKQSGKDKVVTNTLPTAQPDWGGVFERMNPQTQTGTSTSGQLSSQQKRKSPAGKKHNQDKQQSSDLNQVGNSTKANTTSSNTPDNQSRQNGKGQMRADSKQFDQLALQDEAIITTSSNTKPAQKSKGRDLVKFSHFEGQPDNNQTLEESGETGNFDQFQDKKTSYRDELYSTKLDMDNLDEKTIQKGKKLEAEINNASTRNRHQAAERNQVTLKDNDEDSDEESKYGAVDRKNQNTIERLDGQRNVTKGQQKFQNFHETIDKAALDKMTSQFLTNLGKKDPNDTMLAPNSLQPTPGSMTKTATAPVPAPAPAQAPAQMAGKPGPQVNTRPIMFPQGPGRGPPNFPPEQMHQPQKVIQQPQTFSGAQQSETAKNTNPFQTPSVMKTESKEFEFKPTSGPFVPSQPTANVNPPMMPMDNVRPFQPKTTFSAHGQNPASYQPMPFNKPMHGQGFQPQMQQPYQQSNNQQQFGFNQGQQYGGGYRNKGQFNNNFNAPSFNNNPPQGMPLPGQQQNMMQQQQQPMQSSFQPPMYGGGQAFQQKNEMPLPSNKAQPTMPMPGPNQAPTNNMQSFGQASQQPITQGQFSSGPPSNPFTQFVANSGSTFKPNQSTNNQFKPKEDGDI